MKRKRALLAIGAILIAALATLNGLVAYGYYSLTKEVERKTNEERAETLKYLPSFMADIRLIESVRPFQSALSKAKKDAGPYLNPRLTWEGANGSIAFSTAEKAELPIVPEGLRSKISKERVQWADVLRDAEFEKLDSSWLHDLRAYDHWDIDINSPREIIEKFTLVTQPLPSFLPLFLWCKVHLLKAFQHKSLKHIEDVRHLVHLVLSTETLVGAQIAAAILRLEVTIRKALNQPEIKEYVPLTQEQVRAFRRSSWGFGKMLTIFSHDEAFHEVMAIPDGTPGYCAALHEALAHAFFVHESLESKYATRYNAFDLAMKSKAQCRLTLIRRVWRKQPQALGALHRNSDFCTHVSLGTDKPSVERKPSFCAQNLLTRTFKPWRIKQSEFLAMLPTPGSLHNLYDGKQSE